MAGEPVSTGRTPIRPLTNGYGEKYGTKRLEDFVAAHAHEKPAEFIQKLHAYVVAHAQRKDPARRLDGGDHQTHRASRSSKPQ